MIGFQPLLKGFLIKEEVFLKTLWNHKGIMVILYQRHPLS